MQEINVTRPNGRDRKIKVYKIDELNISKKYSKPFKRRHGGQKAKILSTMGYKVSPVILEEKETYSYSDVYLVAHDYDSKTFATELMSKAVTRNLRTGKMAQMYPDSAEFAELKERVAKKLGYKSYEHYLEIIKAEQVITKSKENLDELAAKNDELMEQSTVNHRKRTVEELDDLEL